MRSFLTTCVFTTLALAASPASAQCTIKSASFSSYGAGCISVNTTVPKLDGKFDSSNCRILLGLSAYGGCCNTFLRNRLYLFGVNRANVPVPFFGRNCVLLTSTDFIVIVPVASGSTLTVPLPKGIATGTAYVQGAAHYFTTIGGRHNYQFSNGLAVTIK